jgi:hypothetical protein
MTDELLGGRNLDGRLILPPNEINVRVTDKVIETIQELRHKQTGHEVAMKNDFKTLSDDRDSWQRTNAEMLRRCLSAVFAGRPWG